MIIVLIIMTLAVLATQMFIIVAVLETRDAATVIRRIATREFFRGEIQRKFAP